MHTRNDSVNGFSGHALVTGGAGFIGSLLTRKLLDRGFEVTVLDNLSVGTRAAVDKRARFFEGDVRDRDTVSASLEGVDCVFHLAARVTVRGSLEMFYKDVDTNLMGTLNLFRCLNPEKIRRFTLASSMAVYADSETPQPLPETYTCDPISVYGTSKLAAERIALRVLADKKIPFSALRYFNTYGPGQTYTPYVGVITIFVNRLSQGQEPEIYGDGRQTRDFVHVEDITDGTIASLSGPPGCYNLGTGRGISVLELADLISEKINPSLKPVFLPSHPGELRNSVADIKAAQNGFGYKPVHDLKNEIETVIEQIKG